MSGDIQTRDAPLVFRAGRRARARLLSEGLSPDSVGAVTAAAGGPKFLAISGIDKFLFSRWLTHRRSPLPLVGSSSGAWRFAALTQPDPLAAHERLMQTYINQRFSALSTPADISNGGVLIIETMLKDGGFGALESHPFARLHIVTARCRAAACAGNRITLKAALSAAVAANALSRSGLQLFFQREVFSDTRAGQLAASRFPGFDTLITPLADDNFKSALLASASIPLLMEPVQFNGNTYLDGALIDYHMDLPLSDDGIVLAPHFSSRLLTGWLDGFAPWRSPSNLDNTLVVHPSDAWIASLPDSIIPSRHDFHRYEKNDEGRIAMWNEVVQRSDELGDYLARVLEKQNWSEVLG